MPNRCKTGMHRGQGVLEYQRQIVGLRPTSVNAVVSGILRVRVQVNVGVYEPWKAGVTGEIEIRRVRG